MRPAQFGTFLRTVFDEWVHNDVGKVYVQTFEAAVRNFLGMASSGMCVFDKTCGHGLALEHNGDVYSCDHFVNVEHRLGNIADEPSGAGRLRAAAPLRPRQARGGAARVPRVRRALRLPRRVPEEPLHAQPGRRAGLNYLCEGYKDFFHHVDGPLKRMRALLSQGQPAAAVMPLLRREAAGQSAQEALRRSGRNQACPCGSGRKYKHCHGEK